MALHDLGRRSGLLVDAMSDKPYGPGGQDQTQDDEANDLMAGLQARCLGKRSDGSHIFRLRAIPIGREC